MIDKINAKQKIVYNDWIWFVLTIFVVSCIAFWPLICAFKYNEMVCYRKHL